MAGAVMEQTARGRTLMLLGAPRTAESAHILAFHGGGGVDGSAEMMLPFAEAVTAEPGVVMALASYRTLNRDAATLDDMRRDAAEALEWACGQLPQGAPLFLLGASFGGLLALDALTEAPQGAQDKVAGVILLNPVTETGEGGFENRVIRAADHASLSPLVRLDGHPLLTRLRCYVAHGTNDDVVPIEASQRFARMWPDAGCTFATVPDAGHGFFNRPPHLGSMAREVRAFVGAPVPTGQQGPKPHVRARSLLPSGACMVYGVGAQKAGTSWLFDHLKRSPDCHTAPIKELHYFDVLHVKSEESHHKNRVTQLRRAVAALDDSASPQNRRFLRQVQTLAERLSIHASASGDHRAYVAYMTRGYAGQKIICDFTPSYCTLDAGGFADMDSIGPARFIFVMRDPVDRLWSQIRMANSTRHPDLADEAYLEKCVEHARDMKDKRDISRIPRVDYARTIAALEEAISPDRVHYMFYEHMFSQESVDRVSEFLGIPSHPVAKDKQVNLGRSSSLPDEVDQMLTDALAPQYSAIRARFGDAVPEAWRAAAPVAARGGLTGWLHR